MLNQLLASLMTATLLGSNVLVKPVQDHVLSSHQISLSNRQAVSFVNDVFKYNILLNIAYLNSTTGGQIKHEAVEVNKPFSYQFKLEPNQTFAFHEDVLDQYTNKVVKTTNAHFNSYEGFKSDGYLIGDGVCHLASLIYWVARDGNLETLVPTNHNFMPIADIAREYGVAIYYYPGMKASNARQNLYITNNRQKAVAFVFNYQADNLKVSLLEVN